MQKKGRKERNMKKVLSIALALVMMVACLPLNAEAADRSATFSITPSKTSVEVGEKVTFTVAISTGEYSATNAQFDLALSDGLELVDTGKVDPDTGLKIYESECANVGGNSAFNGETLRYAFSFTKVKGDNVTLLTFACNVTAPGTQTVSMKDSGLKVEYNGTKFDVTAGSATVTAVKAPCKEHAYDNGVVTKEATCTETGVKTYTCTECGATKTESIDMIPHTPGEWETETPATCNTDGKEVQKCTVCKNVVAERPIKAAHTDANEDGKCDVCGECSHRTTEWKVEKEANCTEDGLKVEYCTVCKEKTGNTEVIPNLGGHKGYEEDCKCDVCGEAVHGETEWKLTKEPTCEENGEEAEYCKVCGEATGKTRAVAKLAHVDADGDGICDVCKKEIEHKHVDANKDGICDVCGEKIEASKTGDNASIALYATMMLAAAAVVVFKKRRVEA